MPASGQKRTRPRAQPLFFIDNLRYGFFLTPNFTRTSFNFRESDCGIRNVVGLDCQTETSIWLLQNRQLIFAVNECAAHFLFHVSVHLEFEFGPEGSWLIGIA